ncbi:MAG: RNB domain-containing ribonuclease [Deltaproteobacteria bacterium]|nr:RNB domain-containing ribonuclease [Deltaproteobacteria bacterium]
MDAGAQDSSAASDADGTKDAGAQDASAASEADGTKDAAPDAAAQVTSPASDAGSTLDAAPDAAAQDAPAASDADGTKGAGTQDSQATQAAAPARTFLPPPDDGGMLVKALTELALTTDEVPQSLKGACEALAEAGFTGDAVGAAKALEAVGVFGPHEDLDLRRLGLPLEFPEEAQEEAELLAGSTGWMSEDRLDLTGDLVITVDSPGAMEFDDAVSLKPGPGGTLTLGVHIADASAFVTPGSALDRFASERGASIYLPEGRYPMLPMVLTANRLSLTAGTERPAFSIIAEIGPDGQVTDASFRPSIIRVARHLTFTDADEILAGTAESELAPLLSGLAELSQKFLKRRIAAGGHIFNIPSQQVILDERGEPVTGLVSWGTPACVTVGELMIQANSLAANTLRNADFPCPYRYQLLAKGGQSPLATKSDKTPREILAWHLALRRRLGRSGMSGEPSRHRGLGLDCYTYFTSPMRRYFDLLVHRQLRALCQGEGPAYDENAMMAEAFNADAVLKAIHKLQGSRTRYWTLYVLSKLEGKTVPALCFDRQGRRVRLCLTDWMVETESMSFPESVEPGHELEVRILRADPARKLLECGFAANLSLNASLRV